MKISRKAWNDYISKLAKCNKGAADAMWAYMSKHGIEDVEALINYGYAVATKYGEASAAIAAEMYDATAALAGATVPAAVPAETATYGEVTAAVKKSAEYSNQNTIANTVARLVKQAGADTTIQNAARDNAQWAWIPSGDTCAFCIALASRGWQYASKKVMKGDHAQHIHANCDCTFAVRFDEKSSYDSYDPKKYEDIYNSAEGSSSKDKINAIRRENYKLNKDEINASKRINYESLKSRKESRAVAKSGKDGIIKSTGKFNADSTSLPTVMLPKEEYAHVMSEIATNLTAEQKQKSIFEKLIGKNIYTVENKGFGEYRIIGKKEVTQGNIDEIW